jgi:hypothetical protein
MLEQDVLRVLKFVVELVSAIQGIGSRMELTIPDKLEDDDRLIAAIPAEI